ncbi:hypothetical protein MRB53_018460 [Persea americana]|uniref:Uncharacterized protein n=1 Tax=Persea americana TaxID=3435 RepID=A0ACC2M8W8_PERAE|nr:hypothetical protein MRB53_018460 [Persea americana]
MVTPTARDVKKDLEAVRQLKESGLSNVVFHQLDVNSVSIAYLADFIKTQFGKLDILTNARPTTSVQLTDQLKDMVLDECEVATLHRIDIEEIRMKQAQQEQEACNEDKHMNGGAKRILCTQHLESSSASLLMQSHTHLSRSSLICRFLWCCSI